MSIARRIILHAALGAVGGVCLTIYALAVHLLSRGAALQSRGLALAPLIVLYIGAGLLGGATFGLLAPLARHRLGAMALGFFAVLPLYAGAVILVVPRDEWSTVGLVLAVAAALLVGAPVGYRGFSDSNKRTSSKTGWS
jgi:hypothetical protein